MKNSHFKIIRLLIVISIVAFVAVSLLWEIVSPPRAQAQTAVGMGQAASWSVFTNVPSIIYANSNALINSVITLRRHDGIAILPFFAFTNGNAGTNVQFKFAGSPDGTNWTTSDVFSMTVAGNGATGVLGYTNVPFAWLDNIRYLRLSVTNQHTSSLFITNVFYSFLNP